jgi:hypothetical protein
VRYGARQSSLDPRAGCGGSFLAVGVLAGARAGATENQRVPFFVISYLVLVPFGRADPSFFNWLSLRKGIPETCSLMSCQIGIVGIYLVCGAGTMMLTGNFADFELAIA